MTVAAAASTGFLVAVLWFDLMFDVQSRRTPIGALPQATLDSIAGYYQRVTTEARPMNRLVALAMLVAVTTLTVAVTGTDHRRSLGVAAIVLLGGAITLAAARTVRNAVRLGEQADDVLTQSALARAILRDHLACLVAVGSSLACQLLR